MDKLPPATRLISEASLKNSASPLLKALVGTVNLETARSLIHQGSTQDFHAWLMTHRAALGEEITRTEMAIILGRLTLHFARPDFTQSHVDLIVDDFLAELNGATPEMINHAARCWLRDPANRFFPTPGGLLQYCGSDIRQRAADLIALNEAIAMLEVRDDGPA